VSAFVVWRHRAQNRWCDLRAVLAGYCNHIPYDPIPGQGGGYANWRCARRRGHEGMHRFVNYVWSDDGRTDYLPVRPVRVGEQETDGAQGQPWKRSMTRTRAQDRRYRRWLEGQRSIKAEAGCRVDGGTQPEEDPK
jgi:hypothetical protein